MRVKIVRRGKQHGGSGETTQVRMFIISMALTEGGKVSACQQHQNKG